MSGEPKLPPMIRYSIILKNSRGVSIITDRDIDLTVHSDWLVAVLDDQQETWGDGNFRPVHIRTKDIDIIIKETRPRIPKTHRYRKEAVE